MAKGVLIIACGHPIYGNMAFNLALTIKYNAPCHITVAYSEQSLSELSDEQIKYFDKTIEVPEKYYLNNGKKAYQRIKVYANEITPYEETILIDADTIWNLGKDIKLLFNQDHIFNIGVLGKWEEGKETFKGYTYWANPTKIVEYWQVNKIYKTYSGFIYWKRESDFIWKECQRVYDDPEAPCAEWAGGKPDEYGFNIGIPLSGYSLPSHEYMPVFFGFTGYKYTAHLISKNFEGMSVAGNFPDPYLITAYHQLLRTITRRIGVPHKEYVKKGAVLEERKRL